jgi:hypothetical protein
MKVKIDKKNSENLFETFRDFFNPTAFIPSLCFHHFTQRNLDVYDAIFILREVELEELEVGQQHDAHFEDASLRSSVEQGNLRVELVEWHLPDVGLGHDEADLEVKSESLLRDQIMKLF